MTDIEKGINHSLIDSREISSGHQTDTTKKN